MEYELFYLILASKKQDIAKIQKDTEQLVTDAGGTYAGDPLINDRKLAYEIKKENHGTYIAQRFTLPDKDEQAENASETTSPNVLAEITKQLNLVKDIARFIIVKADDLPTFAEVKEQEQKREKRQKKVIKTSDDASDKQLADALNI